MNKGGTVVFKDFTDVTSIKKKRAQLHKGRILDKLQGQFVHQVEDLERSNLRNDLEHGKLLNYDQLRNLNKVIQKDYIKMMNDFDDKRINEAKHNVDITLDICTKLENEIHADFDEFATMDKNFDQKMKDKYKGLNLSKS